MRAPFLRHNYTLYLVTNTPDIFRCNLNKHFLISIIFSTKAIEIWFIFPPHLSSVSALPCKTDKHKNSIFSLNVI